MKKLLQFLIRYSIFFLFVILEAVAFVLLSHRNAYQRNAFLSSSNVVSAYLYSAETAVLEYFFLRQTNRQLAEENTALHNQIVALETQLQQMEDSVFTFTDTPTQLHYIGAKVVNITTNQQHNYLTINKGKADGVGLDMGVCSETGVVGIVSSVSEHFAMVIPVINPDLSISCRLKKNDYIGSLQWDGRNKRTAELKDIARHVQIEEGDTIITSGLSTIFPKNIPVGTVQTAHLAEGDAYYTIKVQLFTDFNSLYTVQVIQNLLAQEQKKLEEAGNDE